MHNKMGVEDYGRIACSCIFALSERSHGEFTHDMALTFLKCVTVWVQMSPIHTECKIST